MFTLSHLHTYVNRNYEWKFSVNTLEHIEKVEVEEEGKCRDVEED